MLNDSDIRQLYRGKVQLVFTSPPFPLNRKEKYGNLGGDDYSKWRESRQSDCDLLPERLATHE